jgi:CBS domain-containing protein
MELRDIMSTNVQTISPENNIKQAAQMMEEYNIGSIPVCDNDKIIGVVTDRDIVLRNVAKGQNPVDTKISNVMSTDIKYGSPSMDVHEAAEMMADYQIRRLPVVDSGKVIGIVALGDLAVDSKLTDNAGNALSDISKNY